ncbi:DNA polymerase III subunit gamma/tau [Streptococcus ovuberis]|uniref:DNA-directed DNA polymerase n=1 Tax=Streptococcus ovuberis TaxID=1936207 RepID=A0A7X6MZI7_9STRE|nr:DNA polymerase III subunit gamma/tau [Streptococcus ovuberis]NKZ21270.1 DNA polymerase III subunit gamma/tau [Streptococcus ovuberis]
MYQALYRKYRSQSFGEMVGQEVVATTLKQAVASGKISHAYLFSGPRGTGKTSAAKIFAKAMNCPNQVDGEPCNSCHICQQITQGSLEDVIEIDAASNNGVDEIRDIRDKSTYAPSLAEYKVYIIDEVHMLSTGAFNALLKTLEEPTSHVVFILATTELHKIPATILSRVQRFEFKAIQTNAIQNHLAQVLQEEQVSYDNEALAMIARRAEGGMRDALSILDQALSLSAGETVDLATVEEITGSISLLALDNYVAAILAQDSQTALEQLQTIFEAGKSMSRFAVDLLTYLRDMLLAKSGVEQTRVSDVFKANLLAETEQIFQWIDQVTLGLSNIKASAQPKIYAEVMTIRLTEPTASVTGLPPSILAEMASLQEQVKTLQDQLKKGLVAPAKPSQSGQRNNPAANSKRGYQVDRAKVNRILEEAVDTPQLARENLTRLQNAWGEVIEHLSGADRALLTGSQPVAANENHAILSFESRFNAEQTMKRDNLNLMFGNILSQAAGFSPEILAIAHEDWLEIRRDFSARAKGEKKEELAVPEQVQEQASIIPESLAFLADALEIKED